MNNTAVLKRNYENESTKDLVYLLDYLLLLFIGKI